MVDSRNGTVLFSFFTTNFVGVDISTKLFGKSGSSGTPTVVGLYLLMQVKLQMLTMHWLLGYVSRQNISLHF